LDAQAAREGRSPGDGGLAHASAWQGPQAWQEALAQGCLAARAKSGLGRSDSALAERPPSDPPGLGDDGGFDDESL